MHPYTTYVCMIHMSVCMYIESIKYGVKSNQFQEKEQNLKSQYTFSYAIPYKNNEC